MATTSTMLLPLGTIAPDFKLINTRDGKLISLPEKKSQVATVIMFICNHCPYVKLIRNKMVEVAAQYQQQQLTFIAISSNDAKNYPADSPEQMREEAELYHYPFAYLYDETQEVAKAYQAACTPDFYVFDADLACVYRGRFDDATPGNQKEVTGNELCAALDNIIAGKAVSAEQNPSIGCSIKWK
ncbi:MAG: thioredoxin family protein [Pseudomonadota bacterium]